MVESDERGVSLYTPNRVRQQKAEIHYDTRISSLTIAVSKIHNRAPTIFALVPLVPSPLTNSRSLLFPV